MNRNEFIKQYSAYLVSIKKSLSILKADITYLSNGGKLIYALDFSELFYYLHPFADMNIESTMTRIPKESENDALIREQIALNFIIHHLKETKVILPPYLVELRDHIRMLKNNVLLSNLRRREHFEEYMINAIQKNEQYAALKNYVENRKTLRGLDKENARSFIEFVKSDFKPLYLALTLSPNEISSLLDTISKLFYTKKIIDYSSLFPQNEDSLKVIQKAASEWYQLLRQKNSPQKDYARYLDGLACAYIDYHTVEYHSKNVKFLFVTRSHRMLRIFNSKTKKVLSIRKCNKGEFRDLDYLMTYLRFSRKTNEKTLEEVEQTLGVIRRIESGIKHARYMIDNEIENQIIKLSNSKENLNIALANNGINIENEYNPYLSITQRQKEILNTIYRIVVEDPVLSSSLKEESRIVTLTTTHKFNYYKLFNSFKEINQIISNAPIKLDNSGFIELHPLRSELPVVISIFDSDIVDLAKKIIVFSGKYRNKRTWHRYIQTLLTYPPDKVEIVILRSYLFALLDYYEIAYNEIEIGIHNTPNPDVLKEMLLLKMIYARKTKQTLAGVECFTENKNIIKNDPRHIRELSVLIWQIISQPDKDEKLISGVTEYLGEPPSIDLAIKLVRKINNRDLPVNLRSQILNSLSYYYAEKYFEYKIYDDLERMQKYLSELCELLPPEKWISRFYHTKGWIYFLLADARLNPIKNIEISIESIQFALSEKNAPKGEVIIWRKHLSMARLFLRKNKGLNEMKIKYTPPNNPRQY